MVTVDLDALEALAREGRVAISPAAVLALIERIRQLEQSNATKATRIAELLAAMVRITNETPFPDEMARWTEQRAALVAEVGTLKARVAELERERPCCVHPVARHAYNGCAECECLVRWPQHPDAPDDWSAKRVERLNVATERAAGNPDYQPAWTRHRVAAVERDCTCAGACKGADGLAPGWRCALRDKSEAP